MNRVAYAVLTVVLWISLSLLQGCTGKSRYELVGTWKGTTKIDQDITITIRPDSTIEIETDADSVKQVRKGVFRIVDRRLRISLRSLDVSAADSVQHKIINEHDEALFTLTHDYELVLRRGNKCSFLSAFRDRTTISHVNDPGKKSEFLQGC